MMESVDCGKGRSREVTDGQGDQLEDCLAKMDDQCIEDCRWGSLLIDHSRQQSNYEKFDECWSWEMKERVDFSWSISTNSDIQQ